MLSACPPDISGQRGALSVGEQEQGWVGEGRPLLFHLPDRAVQVPGLIDHTTLMKFRRASAISRFRSMAGQRPRRAGVSSRKRRARFQFERLRASSRPRMASRSMC